MKYHFWMLALFSLLTFVDLPSSHCAERRPGTAFDTFFHRRSHFVAETEACTRADGSRGLNQSWVGECGGLANRDLRKNSFVGYTLAGADLTRASLVGNRTLRGILLQQTRLDRVDASHSVWETGTWARVSARDANFENSTWIDQRLSDVNLSGATMAGIQIQNFVGERINFSHSSWQRGGVQSPRTIGRFLCDGCIWDDADLSGLQWNGAELQRGSFLRVTLHGTSFKDSNLWGARFIGGVEMDASVEFKGAVIAFADFSSGSIEGTSFESTNAEGSIWRDARLSGYIHFRNSNLRSSDWTGAVLGPVDFDGADLSDANFSGASLSRTSFRGAKLNGARFDGARMDGVEGITQ